ncbi:MAG: chromate efflux transporter [Desulfomonile tiedjei]|uniref:Chromate efflux transporter n=1 Tax=Desulfomonile tiedjei TaxID=2358 RepID=A0A9D6V603_9BACT|nr:chromate efflux transporter [Desulfomonile tiedjei]
MEATDKTENPSHEPVCEGITKNPVTFREAFWVWVKVALNSFGGPAGQIAVMHRYIVEEKKWISESRFLHALNYCMLLPGPEAQQLATYIGWLLHRTPGGIVAGTVFVIPGFLAILILSILYAGYQNLSVVQWLFFGLKPAVLAVVVEAVLRIGKRALKNRVMLALAGLAFAGIFFFDVPFPVIVFAAAVLGYIGGRLMPDLFPGNSPDSQDGTECGGAVVDGMLRTETMDHIRPSLARALRVGLFWSALWLAPTVLLFQYLGPENVFFQQAVFFSKSAAVTFGGAYAVLAYVAQQAVDTYGWLRPGEMLDGLGLAETTPGPLIMVLEFVGFLASYRNPGGLHPMVAGMLGAVLTTWVTFVPCFLWIFLGAPYIESLRGNKNLNSALSAITAAVVGVVLNLAVWFALNTVFGKVEDVHTLGMHLLVPVWNTLNMPSLAIAVFALTAIFRFKISIIKTICFCGGLGMAYHAVCQALL